MISIFVFVHDAPLQCAWIHIVHRGNFKNDLSDAVVNLCRLKNQVYYENCNSQLVLAAALLWLFSKTSPKSQESGVWRTQSLLKWDGTALSRGMVIFVLHKPHSDPCMQVCDEALAEFESTRKRVSRSAWITTNVCKLI
jgi:hypothetical protein